MDRLSNGYTITGAIGLTIGAGFFYFYRRSTKQCQAISRLQTKKIALIQDDLNKGIDNTTRTIAKIKGRLVTDQPVHYYEGKPALARSIVKERITEVRVQELEKREQHQQQQQQQQQEQQENKQQQQQDVIRSHWKRETDVIESNTKWAEVWIEDDSGAKILFPNPGHIFTSLPILAHSEFEKAESENGGSSSSSSSSNSVNVNIAIGSVVGGSSSSSSPSSPVLVGQTDRRLIGYKTYERFFPSNAWVFVVGEVVHTRDEGLFSLHAPEEGDLPLIVSTQNEEQVLRSYRSSGTALRWISIISTVFGTVMFVWGVSRPVDITDIYYS